MAKHSIPFALVLLLGGGALCAELRIKSASEFVEFSNNVNSGTNYEGTTVLLDSDIDFSGVSLTPVGSSTSKYFLGTFDGQGHIIKNLGINPSSSYMGLFGYSRGTTIMNVVMDSSCSITSTSSSGPDTGAILGYCRSDKGDCIIDGCVNMADVLFNGTSRGLGAGGIVGIIYNSNYEVTIKNCANYGTIGAYGTISGGPYFGGIVGGCSGSTTFSNYKNIQNCFNYGSFEFDVPQESTLYIGGMTSLSVSTILTNCLSAGKITLSREINVGAIVGAGLFSTVNISHCFWTNEAWDGNSAGSLEVIETDSSKVTSPIDALADLNTQASDNGWNKWVVLHLDGGRMLNLEQEELIVSVEPFPEPVRVESTFLYWCTDIDCEGRYEYKTTDLSVITGLYAHYYTNQYTVTFVSDGVVVQSELLDYGSSIVYPENLLKEGHSLTGWDNGMSTVPAQNVTITAQWRINNYTLTFDFNNGEENDVRSLIFNSTIDYPDNPLKTGYSFAEWSPNPERVGAMDLTITAQWTANKYTVTFDANGGNVLSESESKKEVTYDSPYGDLPTPTRTGYSFTGWFTEAEGGVEVTNEITVNILNDQTLYAHWSINNYTVTFDFNNGEENDVRSLDYNEEIVYPEDVLKTGYSFNGWDKNIVRMPADNITITALWRVNEYTVTFDVNGGNALPESELIKEVTYYEEYGDLPTPSRTGHLFIGWFNDKNESVTSETTVTIPNNHTLHARWEKATNQVEIVFGTKDLTEKRAEDILRQYTDSVFKIIKFEGSDNGETTVIIEFTDVKSAGEFVRSANERDIRSGDGFMRISFVSDIDESLASLYNPQTILLLFLFLFLINIGI